MARHMRLKVIFRLDNNMLWLIKKNLKLGTLPRGWRKEVYWDSYYSYGVLMIWLMFQNLPSLEFMAMTAV